MLQHLSSTFQVWRNKRRLADSQEAVTTGGQQVMDQATQAMLAVFVSNLLLCLQHSIYHIATQDLRIVSYVIVHCIFYTHLFIDPLAYLCFNRHHRRHVLHTLAFSIPWVTCRHPSPFSLHTTSRSILPLQAAKPISNHGSREEPR